LTVTDCRNSHRAVILLQSRSNVLFPISTPTKCQMPPKKHKGKGPASAPVASSMFVIDYASDLGKVAQMSGSFSGMKGDDADSLFD
jgi:hypothetical protein